MNLNQDMDMSFEDYVKGEFDDIKVELHSLNAAINGNGREGMRQVIERHSTYFKMFGAGLMVLVTVVVAVAPHVVLR